MNKVILIGRLIKDPDVKQGSNNTTIARYTLAVDRQYRKNNEKTSDFINCITLGKNGEFAEKYLRKGMKIAVTGSWQTGNYTGKDGKKIYTNDCLVETHEFVESKKQQTESEPQSPIPSQEQGLDDIMNVTSFVEDDDLPFL
jgi:single-strand DNA-binding protein